MDKSKTNNEDLQQKESSNGGELFKKETNKQDEIESDGSASAFDETETVSEDNFDDLSEK